MIYIIEKLVQQSPKNTPKVQKEWLIQYLTLLNDEFAKMQLQKNPQKRELLQQQLQMVVEKYGAIVLGSLPKKGTDVDAFVLAGKVTDLCRKILDKIHQVDLQVQKKVKDEKRGSQLRSG